MKHGLLVGLGTLSLLTISGYTQNLTVNESSGLVNLNPDPNGEPWIAGGITFEEWSRNLPPPMRTLPQKRAACSTPLPSKVDNTKHPSFRPVFTQKGGSCAQASGVAYLYTYEINVLRNLSSNIARNQYPYDFTYNFLNAGNGKNGSHSNVGWNIIKSNGVPDVETYGGFGQGNFTRWMSGYDAYYKGMSNRLDSTFSIKIKTEGGILKMKQFLHDHSNGSPTGGILAFSANIEGVKIVQLASGTPEAGDMAVVLFGKSNGHTMTIAGYNDSVRYDYNGDGRYTNNVDLNNDNIIDVRDWEIGAVYIVNSWGTSWGTNGKAYLMYKVLAEKRKNRGIWCNSAAGIRITTKKVAPQLTYKVRMRFNPRSVVRIEAGFSANTNARLPSATKNFGKAFNCSGGAFPMQGVNEEPIEIGLDVSDFLPRMTSSEAAFFLRIESFKGSGMVEHFSIIDYTSGLPVETVCHDKNVAISTGAKQLKIVKSKATLRVVSPNGGEKLERKQTINITWSTKEKNPVEIELRKGGRFHSTIASSAPSTGTFSWKISEYIPGAFDYRIRITNKEKKWLYDESDSNFTIGFPIDSSVISMKTMQTVKINQKSLQPSFSISPNIILLFGYSVGVNVKIITMDGTQILGKTINSSLVNIDISKLSHGMYLLDINSRSIPFVRLK